MRMRLLSFSYYKLRLFLPIQTMRIIYLLLFQAIFKQYQNASRPQQYLQKKLLGYA
jgi:hypothetical protein